jgi:hypothetical protein
VNMQIQYVANGSRRTVRDSVGRELIDRGIAREMRSGEPSQDDEKAPPVVQTAGKPVKVPRDPNVSPQTAKPKREYKRRDMRPES